MDAAQAELLYSLTQEQPTGFLREDRNLSTQLVLLESRTVLAPVARQNDISVEDLAEALEANVVSESEVIQLRLTDTGRRRAANMLQSVVDQYLDASANTQRAELRTYLEGQLQGVVDQIAALRADAVNRQGEIDALAQREQVIRSPARRGAVHRTRRGGCPGARRAVRRQPSRPARSRSSPSVPGSRPPW